MQGNFSWSACVIRVGVPVRIHVSLLLFAALIFGIQWQHSAANAAVVPTTAIATIVALLVGILIHELAHIFAATNLGGAPCHIILTPWGGNSILTMPTALRSQAVIFSAGMFANAMTFLVTATILVQLENVDIRALMNPFKPFLFEGEGAVAFLKILCWTNFQLFAINLLPVAPFDASQLVRTLIYGYNSHQDREKLEAGVMVVGHLVALALFVAAAFLRGYNEGPIKPTWLILVCGGIALLFNSRYEFFRRMSLARQWHQQENDDFDEFEEYDSVYDDDFDDLFSYDDDETESISQWLREKQEDRERIEREIELEEERRVDSILERLHRSGLESLSDEDRELLQRVSDRYRRQRRQGTL